MNQVLNLKTKEKPKKKFRINKREIIVIVFAIILTSVGIRASDDVMGLLDNKGGNDGPCDEGMVLVPFGDKDFCIDQYEASADEDCISINPKTQTETRNNIDDPNCFAVSIKGNIPWRNISQNQAAVACAKAGKRLPTNKEWLQASLGTPDQANNWSLDDCHVADNWGGSPGEAGFGKNCKSSFGVYDMIGNVWEWVDGTIHDGEFEGRVLPDQGYIKGTDSDAIPSETSDISDENYYNDYLWIKKNGTRGMARGGYWANKSEAGKYSIYLVSQPSFVGEGVGFRCVK